MTFTYPARIVKADGVLEVDFPDLPGCITYSETLEKAKEEAAEALTGYLESVIARAREFKLPSKKASGMYAIEPAKSVAFALWLSTKRKESGMTLTDVADKVGVK